MSAAKINLADFDAAIRLLAQAEKHLEKAKDKEGLAFSYLTTGDAYRAQANDVLAFTNYEQAHFGGIFPNPSRDFF
ncbi:MAG: hypothetical protein HC913_07780 [Microscillaceae bacterium]|nr:hypothetical protein [Microscillaceae bacterium]